MGSKPQDDSIAETKPALELPKSEGIYELALKDGSSRQASYSPIDGKWFATDDGKPTTTEIGFGTKIGDVEIDAIKVLFVAS
jgi:hypothetical protein